MKWALVCIEPMMFSRWVYDAEQEQYVWSTSEVPANTIINIIVYDRESPYTPPDNMMLMEVEDDKNIGDSVDDSD